MGERQLTPGSLFANRFEIERLAGSGGMGTVYRARDRYSGDLVALKVLHVTGGSADDAERFAREAQLLSELRHPHIVSHIAHGQTPSGQRFLAMEWLEGHDLGQRLRAGPLALRECLLLFERISDALSFFHQRNIIHRDLKPTKVTLDGENERTVPRRVEVLAKHGLRYGTIGGLVLQPAPLHFRCVLVPRLLRKRGELARYCARPPLSLRRLELQEDGQSPDYAKRAASGAPRLLRLSPMQFLGSG